MCPSFTCPRFQSKAGHPAQSLLTLTKLSFLLATSKECFQLETMLTAGEGNGNPLQYSCLEDPRDRGAWWASRVYGISQSRTRLKRLSMHACMLTANHHPSLHGLLLVLSICSLLLLLFPVSISSPIGTHPSILKYVHEYIFLCLIKHIVLFVYFYLFMAVQGFHCCTQAFSSCSKGTSHCTGFSCCRTQALEYMGSVVVAHGLSCSGMWDLPRPRIESMTPELAGGVLTTGPPGKPHF